jgi:hypothetical protein
MAEPESRRLEACPCPGELQHAYRAGGPCRTVCMPRLGQHQHCHHEMDEPHCLGFLLCLTVGRPACRGRLDTGSKAIRSWQDEAWGLGMPPLTPPFWAICRPLYPIRRFIRAECHTILQTNLTGPLDRCSGAKGLCEDSIVQAGRHIYEAPTCSIYPGSAAISPTRQVNSLYTLLPRTV